MYPRVVQEHFQGIRKESELRLFPFGCFARGFEPRVADPELGDTGNMGAQFAGKERQFTIAPDFPEVSPPASLDVEIGGNFCYKSDYSGIFGRREIGCK
jgi:hypothetical protein